MGYPGSRPARRIFGNLDFETELTRRGLRERLGRDAEVARELEAGLSLPPRVLRNAAALGTLLRVFAVGDDRLHLPAAIPPECMVRGDLPVPRIDVGSKADVAPTESVLAWGETDEIAGARSGPSPASGAASSGRPSAPEPLERGAIALHRAAWALPPPTPQAAALLNDKILGLEVAVAAGVALPGARVIGSIHALQHHLRRGGAASASGGRWVLKGRYSTAARMRVRGAGDRPTPESLRRAARLLGLFGEVLFEPWMERTADYGCTLLVEPTRWLRFPLHRNGVDPGGHFRGITLLSEDEADGELTGDERRRLEEACGAVVERARSVGYRGLLTVDCWRYRDSSGAARFQPLGEINGRLTFGAVARALEHRYRETGLLPPEGSLRLHVLWSRDVRDAPPAGADPPAGLASIPLVQPATPVTASAWIEIARRGSPL